MIKKLDSYKTKVHIKTQSILVCPKSPPVVRVRKESLLKIDELHLKYASIESVKSPGGLFLLELVGKSGGVVHLSLIHISQGIVR